MRNKEKEILEIIDGFKNLTYKIKKDNDDIKQSVKNKDATITSCKTEYQKLYSEYKELQERYNELENYILQLQQQQQQLEKTEQLQQQQQQRQIRKKNIPFYANKKRKHYLINDYDDDDDDNDNDNNGYNEDDESNKNDNEFEYVKIRKKNPKNKKLKKNKGIMEYINNSNFKSLVHLVSKRCRGKYQYNHQQLH